MLQSTMESPQNSCKLVSPDSPLNFCNPSDYVGTLEDIEQPAWNSIASFSESCGSCLSRISSLCLEGKSNISPESPESRLVPDSFHKSDSSKDVSPQASLHYGDDNSPDKLESVHQEDGIPFTVVGSLQSLSSSSKTVYASPRSHSEDQFYCPLSKPVLSEKAIMRRGSLYRERTPSENALDFSNLSNIRVSKLSHSLHDVSSIPSNDLKKPPRRSANVGSSLSALHMRNRSRDSGFIQSESLLSLNSGGRNYDHVESKVKQYIKSIKDADAVRRKERAKSRSMTYNCPKQEDNFSEPNDDPELILLVQKMHHDMDEKDRLLVKLQEDYNCLLGKYAEAENKIDKLRFGWYENSPSSTLGGNINIHGLRTLPSNKTIFKQLKQPSALPEIDDSSLTSSMFLSNFESIESPDSSFHFKEEGSVHTNCKDGRKKEVVVSAPLRPISSLYCTSVRLDRVLPPLSSKSPSTSSTQGKSPNSNNSMITKLVQDFTVQGGTTDTGIDSCCHDEMSATPQPVKNEPIGHLPHEDPILKVQRWQKSLSTRSHPEYSPCSKDKTKINCTGIQSEHQKSPVQTTDLKMFSSIGVQVNFGDGIEFPSGSSRISTPMVPCLNLGELSGCTEEFSESLLSSNYGKKKSISQPHTGPGMKLNVSSLPDSNCTLPSKSFSSSLNLQISSTMKHICEGRCIVCGCHIKSERKLIYGRERREKKISSIDKCQTLLTGKGNCAQKTISQLNGLELAELLSLIFKDQDHVVPTSPQEEESCQHSFKTLEKKINSLKSSVNLQTFVGLLEVFLNKASSQECSCHQNQSFPSQSHSMKPSPEHPKAETSDFSEMDCSLLQCLEELDEYTNQVWAKTESFLEVLNSNRCGSALKPE